MGSNVMLPAGWVTIVDQVPCEVYALLVEHQQRRLAQDACDSPASCHDLEAIGNKVHPAKRAFGMCRIRVISFRTPLSVLILFYVHLEYEEKYPHGQSSARSSSP